MTATVPTRPDPVGDDRAVLVDGRALSQLAGRRILVLNWRDVRHSQAGGAEAYAHEISRRWAAAGAEVTWLTARDAGQAARDDIDGVHVRRAGGTLSVYLRTAMDLVRRGGGFDAIVDCQNGIPFFSPLFTRGDVPVVQVVHHVHQDQFATRFSTTGAAVGRLLEGRVARHVYRGRRTVAVSASTRQELRRRLKVKDVIEVVPNGCAGRAGAGEREHHRAPTPTIVVTSRLVPHKRIDLLLHAISAALPDVPDLAVEVIGGGPELTDLRRMSVELGLGRVVRFHGRLPDDERDALMSTAWLTTSTSEGEGWGCVVLEAAAEGVPCLAMHAPGIRDSVVDGATGWLVDGVDDLAAALPRVLDELADPVRGREVAQDCRAWAECFSWDRSAELMAGVVVSEIQAFRRPGSEDTHLPPADRSALHRAVTRRQARSDMTVLARFRHPDPAAAAAALRLTDECAVRGHEVTALLRGCDEVDALAVLARIGAQDPRVRLAGRHELLGGPALVESRAARATSPGHARAAR